MAEVTETGDAGPKRRPGLFWGAVAAAAFALGGGGYFATSSGLLAGATATPARPARTVPAFVELDPAFIAVGEAGSIRQLRFRAFLETGPEPADHVPELAPRILDICATYLRALDLATLEDPAALMRIRGQLLRRIQLLTGPGAVSDLLIVDFVIT
jgi:flagellar FliL protein